MSIAKVNDEISEGDHNQKRHIRGTCMPSRSTLDDNSRSRIHPTASHPVDHPVIELGPFMTLEQTRRAIKINGGVGRDRRSNWFASSSRQPCKRFFTDEEIAGKKLFDDIIIRQPDADRGVLRQVVGFANTDDIDEILELYSERMRWLCELA